MIASSRRTQERPAIRRVIEVASGRWLSIVMYSAGLFNMSSEYQVDGAAVLDVRQFIDDHPVSRYQLLVTALCAMVVFIAGYDPQVMGPVLPVLAVQLHVERPVL